MDRDNLKFSLQVYFTRYRIQLDTGIFTYVQDIVAGLSDDRGFLRPSHPLDLRLGSGSRVLRDCFGENGMVGLPGLFA